MLAYQYSCVANLKFHGPVSAVVTLAGSASDRVGEVAVREPTV